MRKIALMLSLATAALVVVAQTPNLGPLSTFATTLKDAKALRAEYTYQKIGNSPDKYTIELAKPNLARIDKSDELIIADGKTITVFDKSEKTYYKRPQTDAELKGLFSEDDVALWYGFFSETAFSKVTGAKAAGKKVRKGMSLDVITAPMDSQGRKTVTFFIDPKENLARQAEIEYKMDRDKTTMLLDTKSLEILSAANNDQFVFNAPSDARELSMDELNAGKWYYDLEEAKKIASKTNKLIMIDFMASWCGPCKMMDRDVFATEDFKKMGKYFVFCKIDVDLQPSVAQHYGVTAMPTFKFVKADGSVVSEAVGYRPVAEFLPLMEKARTTH